MPPAPIADNSPAGSDEVLKQAIAWMDEGHAVALAVVVDTWGSSPCPAGSQLAINDSGAFVGSVSGGCIEPIVISEAIDIIADGEPQLLEYGVSDETAREVRLTCGGTLRSSSYLWRHPAGFCDARTAAGRARKDDGGFTGDAGDRPGKRRHTDGG